MKPEVQSESLEYNGYVKVNKLEIVEDGIGYHRELIRRGHSVCVFLYDSQNELVLFTEQFRIGCYPEPGYLLECVAGMIDEGESAQTAACRETREETGLYIEEHQLRYMGTFMLSPGVLSEQTSIFSVDTNLSQVDTERYHGEVGENEKILLKLFTWNEAKGLFPITAEANPVVPVLARNLWLSSLPR